MRQVIKRPIAANFDKDLRELYRRTSTRLCASMLEHAVEGDREAMLEHSLSGAGVTMWLFCYTNADVKYNPISIEAGYTRA